MNGDSPSVFSFIGRINNSPHEGGLEQGKAMFTVGILTISDAVSRGQRDDTSGDNVENVIGRLDSLLTKREVVPDEREQISSRLREWSDRDGLDLVLTTGGTGLAPRDVTPEATRDVIEREVPGLAEIMRRKTAEQNAHAVLSRAVVGTRGKTLIVNLPGSPKGVIETLETVLPVLPHAIQILSGIQADHTPPGGAQEGHAHHGDHHGHRHA